jgi:CRISPR/Cas system-associated exonuclease Cas4 (RecB family)
MSFAWSYSKIDNFETCPKKYYEYSVAKSVKDDSTENIDWGNEVHDAMRDALRKVKPLPEHMRPFQPWVDRVLAGPGDLLVEQKYALDAGLNPVRYYAPTVWYRGIADVVRTHEIVGLAIDWKTGKKKENKVQLGLMALCIFQHFPKVQVVRTEYVWLQEDPADVPNATTQQIFRRGDMVKFVSEVLPRVQKLEWAHRTMTFPPNPSGLCVRYCKVTSCPFHGKGNK